MGRAPCCDKNGLKKGPWTPEEDQKLIDYIQKHGYGNWRTLPKNAGLQRCGKSCRLRWTNYLRPDIKRGRFSFEEEETIIQLHGILGNKWSAIAARLPGRTDNEIKNYWNTHIRKRLLRMGIDPVTHSPRLDLLDLSAILSSSLYNSSQLNNLSRFLGVHQPLVNPELLRVATSLMSSQRMNQNQNQKQSFIDQNDQESQFSSTQVIVNHQYQTLLQPDTVQELSSSTAFDTSCIPFCNEAQLMNHNSEQFPSNLTNFCDQTDQWPNGLSSDLTEDYMAALPSGYDYYTYDNQAIVDPDPPCETTSNFYSNNSNQNFGFTASVLSTPSSSPTPLNSNSTTYINGSCTEDERESYCSSIMKFEIPDILNDFM